MHGAAEGIAKQKFAWNVLPKHCMPQPENHRPRKVPPHAPLAMGSVEGLFLLAASWQTKYGESERDNCLRSR